MYSKYFLPCMLLRYHTIACFILDRWKQCNSNIYQCLYWNSIIDRVKNRLGGLLCDIFIQSALSYLKETRSQACLYSIAISMPYIQMKFAHDLHQFRPLYFGISSVFINIEIMRMALIIYAFHIAYQTNLFSHLRRMYWWWGGVQFSWHRYSCHE